MAIMFDNATSLPMSSIRAACTNAMVMPPPPPVSEEDPGLIFLLAQHKMMHIYDAEEESPDMMKRLLTARMVDRIETDWWAKNLAQTSAPSTPRPGRRARRPSGLSHCNGTSDLHRDTGTNGAVAAVAANPNSNITSPQPKRRPPPLDAPETCWSQYTDGDNSTTL